MEGIANSFPTRVLSEIYTLTFLINSAEYIGDFLSFFFFWQKRKYIQWKWKGYNFFIFGCEGLKTICKIKSVVL